MTLIESEPTSAAVPTCSAKAVCPRRARTPAVGNTPGCEYGHGQDSGVRARVTKWFVNVHQKRVWTVSTPGALDSVVLVSDWFGLGMFSKNGRIFRGSGWFESHLGHVFPLFRGFLASECAHFVHF
ncbi:UNVERIFIED_ORG: hypothetical protein J2X79_004217 [Arthrobacter globiformis]|nr:hypothetical protein [Arthrobacter globiformis]